MARVAREIVIRRPPEHVYRALVDPEHRRQWLLNFDEDPLPPGQRLGHGTRLHGRRKDPTSRSRYEFVVTGITPDRLLAMDVLRNGDKVLRGTFEVMTHPDGSLVRGVNELELKGLLRLASAAVVPRVEAEMTRELESLKRHVETTA